MAFFRVSAVNEVTGTLSITSNGTYDVKKYASANVNVTPTVISDSWSATASISSGTTATTTVTKTISSGRILNKTCFVTLTNVSCDVNDDNPARGATGSISCSLSGTTLTITFTGYIAENRGSVTGSGTIYVLS